MQPQYIYDDSVTPPVQSTLQYTISPDTLWITTSNSTQTVISLIITVYNNTNGPVNCNYFTFGILQGTTQGSLTPDAKSVTGSSDQTATWNAPTFQQGGDPNYPNYYLYKTTPVGGQVKVMQPGDTLIFRLNNIKVTKVEGTSQVLIREKANSNTVTGTLADSILSNNTLDIVTHSFESSPGAPINPGDAASLSWAILNADHWKLFDNDTATLLYNGNSASTYPTGTQPFKPLQTTIYKLIAYADAGETQSVSDYATVMVNKVTLSANINGQQKVTVDAGTPQTINWSTTLANRVKLHADDNTPDQVQTVPASGTGTFQVTPTKDTQYIVSAYYEDGSQSPPVDSTPVTVELDVSVNTPTIKSFNASTLVPSDNAAVTLSWETQSTSTTTINPDGGTFTGAQALKGSTQVTPPPDENTTYTLSANSGQASASQTLGPIRPMIHGWTKITWPSDWNYGSEPHLLRFNRQLWLIDTWCSSSTTTTVRVWHTNDGLTWTNVPGVTLPPIRQKAVAVVFNDGQGEKMWLLGGQTGEEGPSINEIWYSSDGANWTKVNTSGTIWAARTDHACVVFNNKLWVLGGLDAPIMATSSKFYKDVWSSPDGVNWTQHTAPPWSATYEMGAAVFNGKIWVCGGYSYTSYILNLYAEAWSTSDGDSWTQWNNGATPPQTATPWGARSGVTLLTPDNRLWLVGGIRPNNSWPQDMWTMDVNGTWTHMADAFYFPGGSRPAMTVFDWRIWGLATWFAPGSTPPIAWAAAYYVP